MGEKLPKLATVGFVVIGLWSAGLTYLSYERSKLWGDSLYLWEDVLAQFNDCELAYNNRGDILSNLPKPKYKEALSDFNRAIILDPNYDQTYYNRGVVRSHLGDKEGALSDFNKALELKKDYAQAFCNRGATKFEMSIAAAKGKPVHKITKQSVAQMRQNNVPEDVCVKFERAIGNEFKSSNDFIVGVRKYIGEKVFSENQNILMQSTLTKEFKQSQELRKNAIEDFTKAIEHKSNYVIAYSNRGSAFAMLNQLDKAVEDYSRAIMLTPNNPRLYFMRGRLYKSMGKKNEACADLNKVVAGAPNSTDAKQAMQLMKGYCK